MSYEDSEAVAGLRKILDQIADIQMPAVIRRGNDPEPVEAARGNEARVPLSATEKISQLESYLLLTAEARAMAERARIAVSEAHYSAAKELADGPWQTFITGKKTPTQQEINDAKRRANPEVYDEMTRLDWLQRRFTEQIKRLEQDDAATSRAYTFITGG